MARTVKNIVKTAKVSAAAISSETKDNVVSIAPIGDNAQKSTMMDFGAMLGKADRAKFDAAIYYASEVKAGRASLDDSKKFARWYDDGRCIADPTRKASSDKSLNTLVSQYKSFADPEVLKHDGAHYATVEAYFNANDKAALGNRDFYTCCYAANAGIKKEKPAVVDAAFLARRIKAKPGKDEAGSTEANGSTTTPSKAAVVERTPEEKIAVAKSALTASVKQVRSDMVLTAVQTMALNVMAEAFGIQL